MFKIVSATSGEQYAISIEYAFANKEKEFHFEITANNARQAHSIFANNAISFVQSTLDELFHEIQKIRLHYFDAGHVPYVGEPYNQNWTTAYWAFLGLRERLGKIVDPVIYLKTLMLFNFLPLVPVFVQLNHETIKALVQDIKKTAELAQKSIFKIQNYETSIPVS